MKITKKGLEKRMVECQKMIVHCKAQQFKIDKRDFKAILDNEKALSHAQGAHQSLQNTYEDFKN